MKRINPTTGKPFVRGDTRKDGYVFGQYRITRKIKKDGFYEELWYSPEVFNRRVEYNKKHLQKRYESLEGRAAALLNSAKARGTVSITKDWVLEKLNAGVCELSGLPFDLSKTGKINPYSPSLDRIEASKKEYSESNTRLVLTCVNAALNEYGLNHFIKIAKAILSQQKDK